MPLPNAPQQQPMPGGMPPGGMQGGPPPGAMPRSPVGGPGGPGGSPMLSPGSGAGNQAAALAGIEKLTPNLINFMLAFPVGSKEFQQIQRAVESLSSLVGKAKVNPANVQGSKMGIPPGIAPSNSPPPGMSMPPGMPGMSGEEQAA